MSSTKIDNPLDLAKRILRNESAELVLTDELARRIFIAETATKPPDVKLPGHLKLYWLAMCLKKVKQFEFARKVLNRASTDASLASAPAKDRAKFLIKLHQQRALCTYKDTYLPPDGRLDSALKILNEALAPIQPVPDHETLGLRGAIHKRKWEVYGTKQSLEKSLAYYRQGYDINVAAKGFTTDYGYTGINAAFVLELLANIELQAAAETGTTAATALERINEAREIRGVIKTALSELLEQDDSLGAEWWFLTTLADAAFGREEYEEASAWLGKATALRDGQKGAPVCSNKVPDWEYESTARQIALLARVQEENATYIARMEAATSTASPPPNVDEEAAPVVLSPAVKKENARKVLSGFLKSEAGVETARIGKVGLALSGGGFRASLFHIGVLARLAELDVLRHIEVLSCVSGGSIVGAHYYLEVRRLLQETPDQLIGREHYVDIVKRIEEHFLKGVQTNIRTRIASNPIANLRMFTNSDYSRTERAGELYEEKLYARVADGEGDKPRLMRGLTIRPQDDEAGKDFSPKFHNWRRQAKAPILIINATTLNTGHNWHFTASYMGESPANIIQEIDGNCRLRRMYYEDEAPAKHRDITLGRAVAASACVPALFEPLALEDLYEQDMTVRLVDGGVHDNQGIAGLLEQDCTVLLVSDASGQTQTEANPSNGLIGVALRSNNILQSRVREAEYRELDARRRASLLHGLMYIHLRKDLRVDPVDWRQCKDPYRNSDEYREAQQGYSRTTNYGVSKEAQERLALIRTDLDSFSEVEAFALMASGYYMTSHEFPLAVKDFPTAGGVEDWKFRRIAPTVRLEESSEETHREMLRLLDVGQKRGFKIWSLNRPLSLTGRALKILAILALIAIVCLWLWAFLYNLIPWWARVASCAVVGLAVLLLGLKLIVSKLNLKKTRRGDIIIRLLIGLGMGLVGWVISGIHLKLFDRIFLNRGSVERLLKAGERRGR
jgi:predicted acylesterase/phospholipase RssA